MTDRESGDFNDDGKVNISDLNTCLLATINFEITQE